MKKARVAVVGAGGLGCPVLQYIVGAGVGESRSAVAPLCSKLMTGEVTIIDHDTVSASNLHRQVLHTTERVGINKALSACIALKGYVSRVYCLLALRQLTTESIRTLTSSQ